jgi:hypothetical protein
MRILYNNKRKKGVEINKAWLVTNKAGVKSTLKKQAILYRND